MKSILFEIHEPDEELAKNIPPEKFVTIQVDAGAKKNVKDHGN